MGYVKQQRAETRSRQGHRETFVESGAKAPAIHPNGDARGNPIKCGNGSPFMHQAWQTATDSKRATSLPKQDRIT